MKIKLTESQLNRLNILNENTDPMVTYKILAESLNEKCEQSFSKLTFITLGEIINNEVNMERIGKAFDAMDDILYKKTKPVEDWIESKFDEDEDLYNKLDGELYDIHHPLQDKIDSLKLIIEPLITLQNELNEVKITSVFKNKPTQM